MEICIKTQSIQVYTVTAGGSVNLGNTFNMMMGRAAPPVSPPREEMPPEAGLPPRVPVEPGTPPEVPPEAPPGTPPGAPPGTLPEPPPGAIPGVPPGGPPTAPPGAPPGIPGELPGGPVGGSPGGTALEEDRGRETTGKKIPSFYPLRIPDHTVVGLPYYRLI